MKVELWRGTVEPETLIAEAYGICTNKNVPVENIPKWIKMGHESPLEHATATFLIEGISRACLAQLTRHRLASFSVQSMRYVDVKENGYGFPQSIKDGSVEGGLSVPAAYRGAIEVLYRVYEDMVEQGIPKEDARFVLPLATYTTLLMTANFREWRHIINLRTHKSAQWEIRDLVGQILVFLVTVAPNVFKDLKNV